MVAMLKTALAVSLVAIVFLLDSSEAIRCYKCKYTDRKCNEPFNPIEVGTCNSTGWCTTVRGAGREGQKLASRDCVLNVETSQLKEGCRKVKDDDDVEGSVCFCKRDLCNGAISPDSSSCLFILIPAIATIIWVCFGKYGAVL